MFNKILETFGKILENLEKFLENSVIYKKIKQKVKKY